MIGQSIENPLVQSDQVSVSSAQSQPINPIPSKLVLVNQDNHSGATAVTGSASICNGAEVNQGQSGSILGQIKSEYDTLTNTPSKISLEGARPEGIQIKKRKLSTDLGVSGINLKNSYR